MQWGFSASHTRRRSRGRACAGLFLCTWNLDSQLWTLVCKWYCIKPSEATTACLQSFSLLQFLLLTSPDFQAQPSSPCISPRCSPVCVCVYSRSVHYSKCIFIVEPISSSTDSCSGTILCYSCWYFNYRGNLSKSLQLLSSTLMRHFSQNQYCRSQPGLNHLSSLRRTQKLSWHHRSGSEGCVMCSSPNGERVKSSGWSNSGQWLVARMCLNRNFMHKTAGQVVFSQEIAVWTSSSGEWDWAECDWMGRNWARW